jgi:hypothetical protein
MTVYLLIAAVVAVGLAIGGGSIFAARRGAHTTEKSARRQRTIVAFVLVTLAAILVFDAVDTQSHQVANLVLLALMVLGVSFDVAKARLTDKRSARRPAVPAAGSQMRGRWQPAAARRRTARPAARLALPDRPAVSSTSGTTRLICSERLPMTSSANATLSNTVFCWSSRKSWKTQPIT